VAEPPAPPRARPPRLRALVVEGARTHNLQDCSVRIPHGSLAVLTGVSGSGKSSLAFDTIYAEGQRRYMESLSSYARQFLRPVERPDADLIEGLPPTVCVDQRTTRAGPRATVGTAAEVHDLLRLLWARVGVQHCHRCDRRIEAATVRQAADAVLEEFSGRPVRLLAPVVRGKKGFHREIFERLARDGVREARVDGAYLPVDPPPALARHGEHTVEAVTATVTPDGRSLRELEEAVAAAAAAGGGTLLADAGDGAPRLFSTSRACPSCRLAFEEPEPRTFSWSSRHGMCLPCRGSGARRPNDERPWEDPPDPADNPCPSCGGRRLRPEALAVKVLGEGIAEFAALPAAAALEAMGAWRFDGRDAAVATPILREASARLRFVVEVGLGYLELSRPAHTLSGGEAQRLRLAAQVGSGLHGACYVLDEPTIGLHPADNARLLDAFRRLKARGATLVVVEHDEETMRAADLLVDLGPGPGAHGGRVVASGTPAEVAADPASVTGAFLRGERRLRPPESRRPVGPRSPALAVSGARARNLRAAAARFPLGRLTCVTGVSGSGKSTLVREVLLRAVARALGLKGPAPGAHRALRGADGIDRVLEIDADPIGKTPRSVPATYAGVMDDLRDALAASAEARVRGWGPSRFSFNVAGGRCEACEGQGRVRVAMAFLPDVTVTCDACAGRRFAPETLEVRFKGRSIADLLDLPVSEARPLLAGFPRAHRMLSLLEEVGLGYLGLGQSSTTLSGGEAQRLKLAAELGKAQHGRTLYVLDEPTTGLHFADVEVLLRALQRLTDLGNTVVVIEHNLDLVAAADWIVDLGPGAGAAGGRVVASGSPEAVAAGEGETARHLRRHLAR
jgi:excinuclease ABC subunit A